MQNWLKLIGSSDVPVTSWQAPTIGFRRVAKPAIQAGDRIFLYAPGGSQRVFAAARAVRGAEPDPAFRPSDNGSCRWMLQVTYEVNLPVGAGIRLHEIESARALGTSIRQASHVRLTEQEAHSALSLLRRRADDR